MTLGIGSFIGIAVFWVIGIVIYEVTYARKKKKYEHFLNLQEAGQLPEGFKVPPALPLKLIGIRYVLMGVGFGCLAYVIFLLLAAGACFIAISNLKL